MLLYIYTHNFVMTIHLSISFKLQKGSIEMKDSIRCGSIYSNQWILVETKFGGRSLVPIFDVKWCLHIPNAMSLCHLNTTKSSYNCKGWQLPRHRIGIIEAQTEVLPTTLALWLIQTNSLPPESLLTPLLSIQVWGMQSKFMGPRGT